MADFDFDTMQAGNFHTIIFLQDFFRAVDLAGSDYGTDNDMIVSLKNLIYYIALALANIAIGLKEVSVGLRATYIMLEKVDKKLGK